MFAVNYYKLTLNIINQQVNLRTQETILAVWESLIKAAHQQYQQLFPSNKPVNVIFKPNFRNQANDANWWQNYNHTRYADEHGQCWKIIPGRRYQASILIFADDLQLVTAWVECLLSYIGDNLQNFDLNSPPIFDHPQYQIAPSANELAQYRDVALVFTTPLSFKAALSRSDLNLSLLWQLLATRVQHLLAIEIPSLRSICPDFALIKFIPYGLSKQRIIHHAKSQGGHRQPLGGFIGPLIIKCQDAGQLRSLLPWLQLASEIGLGLPMSFGRGHCHLVAPAPALLLTKNGVPTNAASLNKALELTCERHDDLVSEMMLQQELAAASNIPLTSNNFAVMMANRLATGEWQYPQHLAFLVNKANGETRRIEKLPLPALVLQYALLEACAPIFERMFEPQSYGYRPGRSRQQALTAVNQALELGFQWVLRCDVDDFFAMVNHQILENALLSLLPDSDIATIKWIMSSVRSDYEMQGTGSILPRPCGLSQGAPLSPLLANLILDKFDERFSQTIGECPRLVRYADDFVILCKTKEITEQCLRQVIKTLAQLSLQVDPQKTAIFHASEGFRFLGVEFNENAQALAEISLTLPLEKPLYISEPGAYLGLSGEAIEVRKGNKVILSRPIARISEIVLLAPVSLSSLLIARLQQKNISIALGHLNGRHHGCISPDSREFLQRSFRQNSFYQQMSEAEYLMIAREIIAAKVSNQICILKQRYRTGDAETLQTLVQHRESIERATTLAQIRGYEVRCARVYFSRLADEIQSPDFIWQKRLTGHDSSKLGQRPDRINSLLNFTYFLLFSRINASIRAQGLNPYLGFVHETADRFETLSADMQELFRPHIDRLVIRIINLNIIQAHHFQELAGIGYRLTREGAQIVVRQFEAELIRQPKNAKMTLANSIAAQCLALRGWLCDKQPIVWFRLE